MEDMNHTDRSRRLQIAMDPSTSLAALLELAMEFPEAVAANPALPVALAADPAAVESAEAVSIACLMTSPDLPATVGAALEGIFARMCDEDERVMLGDYLEEWRRLGSRRVSINHAQPAACAQGLEVSIERLIRGQALLAKRLGWQKCMGWMNDYNEYEPAVSYESADGVQHDSEDSQFRILWPHWSSNPDSECFWSVDFTKGPTALVTLTEDDQPCQLTAQIQLSGDTGPVGAIIYNVQLFEISPFNLSLDATQRAFSLFGPWLEYARRTVPGQFLVIGLEGGDLRMALTDWDAIRQAVRDAWDIDSDMDDSESDDDFESDDDSESDEDSESPTTPAALFGRYLKVNSGSWLNFDRFFDALGAANGTGVEVGGVEVAQSIFKQVFECLFPRAREAEGGFCKPPDFQIAVLDAGSTVNLLSWRFEWCDGHAEHSFELDTSRVD